MPPLPSTLNKEAHSLIQNIERRRKDIQEFQIPRLQECKGPLSVQQSYAGSLKEDVDYLARQVEELELMVEEQRSERDRKELGQVVQEFTDSIATIRKAARVAALASKRAVDAQTASKRDELLRTPVVSSKANGTEEKGIDDALMKANADVTAALRRTIGLMQTELERSVLSTQMLEQSSATLRSTSSVYDTMNLVLGTSKQLVTALEKSDWMDRLLIIFALVFFLLVVAFILKQRIIDRSLRIAFFWTRFLPGMDSLQLLPENGLEKAAVLTTTALSALSSAAAAVTATASLWAPEAAGSPVSSSSISPSSITSFPGESLPSASLLSNSDTVATSLSTILGTEINSDSDLHDEL